MAPEEFLGQLSLCLKIYCILYLHVQWIHKAPEYGLIFLFLF